jgi:hypothetical protein
VVRKRFLLVLCVLALASGLAVLPGSEGLQNGISGRAVSGCTCHGPSPTAGVVPAIAGLPSAYDPGAAYTLTVSVTGGPARGGGFDLLVDGGTVTPGDPNVQAFSPTEVGHNNPNELTWSVHWTAPPSGGGPVTFSLATNSVNKDGTEAGDAWNLLRAVVNPVGAPGASGASGGATSGAGAILLVVAPALALASLAAFAWIRPAPAAPPERRPRLAAAAPHVVVLILAFAVVFAATAVPGGGPGHSSHAGGPGSATVSELHDLTGFTSDGQSSTEPVDLNGSAPSAVTAVLTWTDEPDIARHTNLPDSFQVTVAMGSMTASGNGTNGHGTPGEVTVDLKLTGTLSPANASALTIVVTCVNAGPQQGVPAGLGLRDRADTGNAWSLSVNATFALGAGAPGAPGSAAAGASAGEPAFTAHAAIEAVGAALVAAALASALVLRGAIPPAWVPARLRPTRTRHAAVGSIAIAATALAAAVGLITAAGEGMLLSSHGAAGLVLVALLALQATAGYLTLRGRPLKRVHGLLAAATVGALLAQGASGLSHFLPS